MIVSRFDEQIERKSKLYGFLGTTCIGTILLVLLLFFYMPTIFLPEEEGILVSFGDSFDGGGTGGEYYGGRAGGEGETNSYATPEGRVEETNAPLPTQTTQTPPQSTSQPTNVATQDDPSAATIAQQKIEQQRLEQQRIAEEQKKALAEQQRVAAEAERQRLAAEAERQRLAEAEQQRLAAEAKKRQEAIDKANQLGSALAGGTTAAPGSGTGFGEGANAGNASGYGTGSGTGTGTGVGDGTENSRQGNPVGRGTPTGNWSLTGRELIGSLVPPVYSRDVEGRVTVSIRVDENGTVADASISLMNTNISDVATRAAALAAARKTRFSKGSGIVTGTITYNFQLR